MGVSACRLDSEIWETDLRVQDFGSRALSCETAGQLIPADASDVNHSSVLFTVLVKEGTFPCGTLVPGLPI